MKCTIFRSGIQRDNNSLNGRHMVCQFLQSGAMLVGNYFAQLYFLLVASLTRL